jgi:hypothetical protein
LIIRKTGLNAKKAAVSYEELAFPTLLNHATYEYKYGIAVPTAINPTIDDDVTAVRVNYFTILFLELLVMGVSRHKALSRPNSAKHDR